MSEHTEHDDAGIGRRRMLKGVAGAGVVAAVVARPSVAQASPGSFTETVTVTDSGETATLYPLALLMQEGGKTYPGAVYSYSGLGIGTGSTSTSTPKTALTLDGLAFGDGSSAPKTTVTTNGLTRSGVSSKTSNYTLALADAGLIIELDHATAITLTVPSNASVAFAVGTRIDLVQAGEGITTVVEAGGVDVRSAATLTLGGKWSGASLYKRATDEWVLVGDLAVV